MVKERDIMGYETKLIIGSSSSLTNDEIELGDLVVEDGEAYRPMLEDDDGKLKRTGVRETWFEVIAVINLCKCGYDSEIIKIDSVNKDKLHQWYWYDGNEKRSEDCYGDKPKPVAIKTLIEALKKDVATDDYRRFKWALALLESMNGDDLTVLMYGY